MKTNRLITIAPAVAAVWGVASIPLQTQDHPHRSNGRIQTISKESSKTLRAMEAQSSDLSDRAAAVQCATTSLNAGSDAGPAPHR